MPVTNLDNLISKLYKDGIDKVKSEAEVLQKQKEEESNKIIEQAEQKANKIIADAKNQADQILSRAKKEITNDYNNILLSLKEKISTAIIYKLFSKEKVNQLLDSKSFMQELITGIVKNWKQNEDINIYFSKLDKKQIDSLLNSELKSIINDGLNIKYNDSDKKGFFITDKNETFQITFDEDTITNLFTDNLKSYVKDLLFGENK